MQTCSRCKAELHPAYDMAPYQCEDCLADHWQANNSAGAHRLSDPSANYFVVTAETKKQDRLADVGAFAPRPKKQKAKA